MKLRYKKSTNVDNEIKKAKEGLVDFSLAILLLLKVLGIFGIWTWIFITLYAIVLIGNLLSVIEIMVCVANIESIPKKEILKRFFSNKPVKNGPIATNLYVFTMLFQLVSAVLIFQKAPNMMFLGIELIAIYLLISIKYVLYQYVIHYYKIENRTEGYILQSYKADSYLEEKETLYDGMDGKSYKKNLHELIERYNNEIEEWYRY